MWETIWRRSAGQADWGGLSHGLSFPVTNLAGNSYMSDTATCHKHELDLPKVGAYATSAQLCNLFQVSRTTWWRWSQAAGFPAAIRIGRSVRWSTEAVESFLISREA